MSNLAQLRFLVADDMLTMRQIVSQQLKSLGVVNIVQANDGTTAWETMENAIQTKSPIQFVISDWNMPQMAGIELLKKCRASEAYKDVAFVLITAEAEATQVKDAIAAGVDQYVVKPFTAESFHEKIKAVLAKRFPG